ncbi:hypothetical protein JWG42_05185 [Desulfoprunum benzoelyticum]|uniref:CxxC motif-containing protein n=1 Tax=Desulfoprunum benzoelyticum TaxID=1506996 RepID=A0A840V5B0_9BACT|nr:hypothetical protein [Desulfoprunum benzoelyticum]MBB5348261.1 CxxC motif-containing protein [Desulfoprunum benzoelyticum]MBM9529546.1 hypothetical protein [Desulfoprunum benzoelyticum]
MKKLTDYKEWTEAEAKLNELKTERDRIEAELTELYSRSKPSGVDKLTAAAEILLSGGQAVAPTGEGYEKRLNELHGRKRVVLKAVEIHERAMKDLRAKLSAEICRELKPQYRKIVQRVADAAMALDAAMQAEKDFRDQLFQADIAYAGHLVPTVFHGVGTLDDDNSRISQFFQEARSAGYLSSIQ